MKRIICTVFLVVGAAVAKDQRPNIVWIMAEDISTELECYGEPGVQTPHLNRLGTVTAWFFNPS